MDKRTIKEIYNISFDMESIPEKDKYGMNEWFCQMINKTYIELDVFDITRMIIQKIFLEMAIERAVEFMEGNPFCGQRYQGEMMELLLTIDEKYLFTYELRLCNILDDALLKNAEYEWINERERGEFEQTVELIRSKMNNIKKQHGRK